MLRKLFYKNLLELNSFKKIWGKQKLRCSHCCDAKTDANDVNAIKNTISDEENAKRNVFVSRSHTCGQLNASDAGKDVTLCGWVQFQRMKKFITIRDSYGSTQLFLNDKKLSQKFGKLNIESVIEVQGRVACRPQGEVNDNMATGEIEVHVNELKILNDARIDIPFIIRDYNNVTEINRLSYRYIDLRHPLMQRNLRLRSNVIMKMRQFLIEYGFIEVETPTLFKRTPGGAQEFIVPTVFPDHYYSLTQSPQQFKQLLMVGAIDRYFQVARCYRDEGTKPDRQPEFTQLDLEMSFTSADGIMILIEELLKYCWPGDKKIETPFKRIKYEDAIRDYGTDKPDLRSDIKLIDISLGCDPNSFVTQNENIDSSSSCIALVIPDGCENDNYNKMTQIIEELPTILNQFRFKVNITYSQMSNAKDSVKDNLRKSISLQPNDFLWIGIGKKEEVLRVLGRIRADCIKMLYGNRETCFHWIVDFPLFLPTENNGLESSHHPFTCPKSSDETLLYTDPKSVFGEHFDLVINGQEVGGGSMRIHDANMQEFVLREILREDVAPMQYFLDALRSGCPPHGGIALGLDRLIAIMCQAESIRDVMAFPKSAHGKDLMSGAPTLIPHAVKQLYHIK